MHCNVSAIPSIESSFLLTMLSEIFFWLNAISAQGTRRPEFNFFLYSEMKKKIFPLKFYFCWQKCLHAPAATKTKTNCFSPSWRRSSLHHPRASTPSLSPLLTSPFTGVSVGINYLEKEITKLLGLWSVWGPQQIFSPTSQGCPGAKSDRWHSLPLARNSPKQWFLGFC